MNTILKKGEYLIITMPEETTSYDAVRLSEHIKERCPGLIKKTLLLYGNCDVNVVRNKPSYYRRFKR